MFATGSLPSWERGLKSVQPRSILLAVIVAPLVGAWIEIKSLNTSNNVIRVAPLVGAWIEIVYSLFVGIYDRRRSPRGSVD